MNSQFNKGIIELCVLSLVLSRDRYGYELVEAISKQIEISEGSIYPILRRLTDEKYFETYLQESNEGPPRKYYKMTTTGRSHTLKLIKSWNEFSKNINELVNSKSK
jgi:PadR family transcriptional regulator, regulatory protein PadR